MFIHAFRIEPPKMSQYGLTSVPPPARPILNGAFDLISIHFCLLYTSQRYIDTILYQTYDNIELILINNGSTDKTEDIILSNRHALEKKCKKFIYIRHENVLQIGASINDLSLIHI